MLVESDSPPTTLSEGKQLVPREELGQMLKAYAPKHPALNRVHAKIIAAADTEVVISRYDRMHHRHSRS
jgi:hypothetical protein